MRPIDCDLKLCGKNLAVNALLNSFTRILLNSQGPEDLPESHWLLRFVFVSYCAIGIIAMVVSGIFRSDPAAALLEVAFDVAFVCFWYWALLAYKGLRHRYVQVLTAALGCGTLLGLLFLPVFVLTLNAQPVDPALPATPWQITAALLYLGLLCWTASVTGHITARALNLPYFTGLGMGVLFVVMELALINALFPIAG